MVQHISKNKKHQTSNLLSNMSVRKDREAKIISPFPAYFSSSYALPNLSYPFHPLPGRRLVSAEPVVSWLHYREIAAGGSYQVSLGGARWTRFLRLGRREKSSVSSPPNQRAICFCFCCHCSVPNGLGCAVKDVGREDLECHQPKG